MTEFQSLLVPKTPDFETPKTTYLLYCKYYTYDKQVSRVFETLCFRVLSTLLLCIPISLAISLIDLPCSLYSITLFISMSLLGLPNRFPLALALRNPPLTLSAIMSRSSLLIALIIVNIASPSGLDVSMFS